MFNKNLKKLVNKIIKTYSIQKSDNIKIDFVRFYILFDYFKNVNTIDNKNKYLKNFILKNNNEIDEIISALNNNSFLLLKNHFDEKIINLFNAFYKSLISYYNIENIKYFFDKDYDIKSYEENQKKYEEYLKLNQDFIEQLKTIVPKDFGSIYNYVKKYKKGV